MPATLWELKEIRKEAAEAAAVVYKTVEAEVKELRDEMARIKDNLAMVNRGLAMLMGSIKDGDADNDGVVCPHCGENDEDKLEETPTMEFPRRVTCLNLECGKSFNNKKSEVN